MAGRGTGETAAGALAGRRVIIVGGSSGIGKAVAAAVLRSGGNVTIVSRSAEKLSRARAELGPAERVDAASLDMTDEAAVESFFQTLAHDTFDHLVISASNAAHGAFASLETAAVRGMFDSKFWGPYYVARSALPKMAKGGSITFFSGVLSRRPGLNCSGLGAVNAAVEGLTRGLALELGPEIRVNCCSPGMVRSEAYAGLPEQEREAMYLATGESLPLRRVGETAELAQAVLFLMTNAFATGLVLDVDGGHMIRQYASR